MLDVNISCVIIAVLWSPSCDRSQEVGGGGGGYWLVVVGVVPASLTISPWPGASTFAWLVSHCVQPQSYTSHEMDQDWDLLLLPGYITHTTNWKRYSEENCYKILSLHYHDDLAVLVANSNSSKYSSSSLTLCDIIFIFYTTWLD